MPRRQEGYVAPPTLAIADGATTPNPGVTGITVWSSTESAPVTWNGSAWKIAPGGLTVNDLPELNPADGASDFLLVWDTSVAASRKVRPNNLGLSGSGLTHAQVMSRASLRF